MAGIYATIVVLRFVSDDGAVVKVVVIQQVTTAASLGHIIANQTVPKTYIGVSQVDAATTRGSVVADGAIDELVFPVAVANDAAAARSRVVADGAIDELVLSLDAAIDAATIMYGDVVMNLATSEVGSAVVIINASTIFGFVAVNLAVLEKHFNRVVGAIVYASSIGLGFVVAYLAILDLDVPSEEQAASKAGITILYGKAVDDDVVGGDVGKYVYHTLLVVAVQKGRMGVEIP